MALLIEVLDRHDRNFIGAHSKKGTRPPPALRVPRPSDKREKAKRRPATPAELKAIIGKAGGSPPPKAASNGN
jgi:hypothetical protein